MFYSDSFQSILTFQTPPVIVEAELKSGRCVLFV